MRTFYDDLAADYRYRYEDWKAAVARQGAALDSLLHRELGAGPTHLGLRLRHRHARSTTRLREEHLCRPVRRSPAEAGRVISFQLWDWHTDGEHYDLEHIQLLPAADTGERQVRTRRTTSWAITAAQLTALVATDGFTQISWHAPGGKPSEWVLGMPVAPLTRGRGGYG